MKRAASKSVESGPHLQSASGASKGGLGDLRVPLESPVRETHATKPQNHKRSFGLFVRVHRPSSGGNASKSKPKAKPSQTKRIENKPSEVKGLRNAEFGVGVEKVDGHIQINATKPQMSSQSKVSDPL